MERPLSLEVLPIVIIDHVASYLSINDINACCATSSKMREAFSDNLIWKRRCDVERINYLKRSACWVKPGFEWDDDKWSNLSPVTGWKKNYMMQAHLFKNWRNGRFEKSELEFGPVNVKIRSKLINHPDWSPGKIEFYKNDILFLHTYVMEENKLLDEIWDVVGTPFLHSTFSLNFDQFDESKKYRLDLYKMVDNKLVVGLRNLILVYDIALGSFSRIPLHHAFLFDMSEKCSKDFITHDENTFYRTTFFEFSPLVEVIVSGSYLVGAVKNFDLPSPTFHIWSIETGKKIEEVIVPAANLNVKNLQFLLCDDGKNIVVKLVTTGVQIRYTNHCYGYDLSKRVFTSFLVKVNYCEFLIFKNKYVIGAVGELILVVYCYETSRRLLRKKFTQGIIRKIMNVVGDLLLIGTFENTVCVLDLTKMDIINEIKLGPTLYSLRVICDKFVVIHLINSEEVWEIGKTAKKLFKFPVYCSFVAVNQYCTKFAIRNKNKIIILHFW